MRAKFLNEKFVEESDPIKDLKIGIKNYEDYIRYKLKEKGYKEKDFWDTYFSLLSEAAPEDIISTVLDVLMHTPLEYQIDWADRVLQEYFENEEGD